MGMAAIRYEHRTALVDACGIRSSEVSVVPTLTQCHG